MTDNWIALQHSHIPYSIRYNVYLIHLCNKAYILNRYFLAHCFVLVYKLYRTNALIFTAHVGFQKQARLPIVMSLQKDFAGGIIVFATYSQLLLPLFKDSIRSSCQLSASNTTSSQKNIVSWCLGFVQSMFVCLAICCWLVYWSAVDFLVCNVLASARC